MKLNRLHSITLTSLLALLLFTGCQDETDALPSEGRRTITLDLGIAMTRAAEDDQVVYGEANDLKIWLFDQKGDFLRYIKVDKPQFTGRDLQGNPLESVEEEFDITDVTQLQFRVLLNTEGLTLKDANESALTLGENTTINEIDAATFQFRTTLPDADNKVPMYGTGGPIPITTSKDYHAEIPLTRAVGKLELFFTKESEDGYLAIDKVELAQVPDKGYLKAPETYNLTYEGTATLFESKEREEIYTSLPESITTGYFSEHEGDFQRIDLMQDYLLENPNPEPEDDKWNDSATGNTDYIYPYDPENPTDVAAQNTRYMMTIHYRTSESETTSKTQIVYLPRIERNVWNKIFARVKSDASFAVALHVMPWEDVEESEIGWDANTPTGSNAPMAAWRLYYKDEDPDNERVINPDHKNAKNGDDEATYCYVLNPRYTGDKDEDGNATHEKLEEASSYAGFYFKLSGPKGAVWKAHLENEEYFGFGNGTYDIDDDDIPDRRCATTGIARDEPYQIQIYAKHPWTSGVSFDNVESEYFEEYEEIKTEFWITVTLSNGQEYELVINPNDDYVTDTYYYNNRRFAGTDTRITIWQLRAKKDYAYDDLMDFHIENGYITNPWWTGEGDLNND